MKEIIDAARELAIAEIEKYGLPSRFNWDTSNAKGQELAQKLGADKDVVMLGTILMDVQLGRAISEKKQPQHAKMSAHTAQELLSRFDLPSDFVNKVVNCAEAHHKEIPFICKEAEICANADCYRFLLPKNVFAFIADNLRNGMSLENALNFAYFKLEEKHNILSLEICKKELEENYQMFKKLFEAANAKPVMLR